LHGGEPDAARGAVDEQRLAPAERGAADEAAPGGLVGEAERRALLEGHEAGQGVGVVLVHDDLLGVRAPVHQREDALADADLRDAGAHVADDARHLGARGEGQRRLRLVLALDEQNVREVAADRLDVEQPGVGDDLRRLGPSAGGSGSSYWWFVEARNKRSITCNLRDPEGQALIRRLVASTAVVTENFRPGTLERWNLGWAELSRVRPALVMLRISAFGQTGPHRARPGFGRIAAAVGGLAYLSGYPDRPPVSPGTPTVPDYLAGVFGALGALVALRHAERTGEG